MLPLTKGEFCVNRLSVSQQSTRTATTSIIIPGRHICPSTKDLFRDNELTDMIQRAVAFHSNGGNLKAIQQYLDAHMQHTLDELELQFTLNGQTSPSKEAVNDLAKYYKQNDVKRGGYGQLLPGKFAGENLKLLADKRWMNVIEPQSSLRQTTAMGPVGPICRNMVKFGESYETKCMCTEPNKTAAMGEDCHLFSIGSNDQWGFEMDARKKLPDCQIHTFDCTLKGGVARKKPADDSVHFYDRCIGTKEGNPKYKGYEALVSETEIQTAPKYLKMDVEGFEFDVLLDWILTAPPHLWPQQIMLEVHWSSRMVDLTWVLRQRQAAELSLFFATLFNRGGYLPVFKETFKGCPPCIEVLFVKVLCETDQT